MGTASSHGDRELPRGPRVSTETASFHGDRELPARPRHHPGAGCHEPPHPLPRPTTRLSHENSKHRRSLVTSEPTSRPTARHVKHVHVNLRRLGARMPQRLLHRPQVDPTLQKTRRVTVAERVGCHPILDSRRRDGPRDPTAYPHLQHVMSFDLPIPRINRTALDRKDLIPAPAKSTARLSIQCRIYPNASPTVRLIFLKIYSRSLNLTLEPTNQTLRQR